MKTFLYLHCTDLEAMRDFYGTLLGLDETYHSRDDATAGYRCGNLQLTVHEHADAQRATDWAEQLGWAGGTTAVPSWGFELGAVEFDAAVERLQRAGVRLRFAEPEWVGYWSFPVLDPMGNTVELSAPDRGARALATDA